jgi:hypothetical protein
MIDSKSSAVSATKRKSLLGVSAETDCRALACLPAMQLRPPCRRFFVFQSFLPIIHILTSIYAYASCWYSLELHAGVDHVAVLLCLAHLWDGHTVDLSASDDATCDWELRAGAHEVGIDLTSALAAFVDTPVTC